MSRKTSPGDLARHLPDLHHAVIDGEWGFVDARMDAGEMLLQVDDNNMTAIDYLSQAGHWFRVSEVINRYQNETSAIRFSDELLPSFVEYMLTEDDQHSCYFEIASRFRWEAWVNKNTCLTDWMEEVTPEGLTTDPFMEELVCYAVLKSKWTFNPEMVVRVSNVDYRLTICTQQYFKEPNKWDTEDIVDVVISALNTDDMTITESLKSRRQIKTVSISMGIDGNHGVVLYNALDAHDEFEYEPFLILQNSNELIFVIGEYTMKKNTRILHKNAYRVNYESVFAF